MDPETEQISNRPNNLKMLSLVIGGMVIVLAATGLGYLLGSKNKSADISLPNSSTISKVSDDNTDSYPDIRIYPSLNQTYYFYVVYPQGGDELGNTKCKFGISGTGVSTVYMVDLLGYNEITCSQGMGSFFNTFGGWANDDRLLIKEIEGIINIYQVSSNTMKNYTYDPKLYEFQGVDKNLKYWLFRKIDQKPGDLFTVWDSENKTVLDNLSFDTVDRTVLYDEQNDGFLFIGRYFENNLVSVKFDWLGTKNLVLKNLLTTDPVSSPGRGCTPEYLVSKPGEVIITQGCLTVAEKYLGVDGNIHLPL